MSASSSRIMIAPVAPGDGSRPLSDGLVDRLLGWWDVGGGRSIRRALRGAVAASKTKIRIVTAPVMARPLVAKTVATALASLTTIRRWISKAFSSDVPAATPRREELHSADVSRATAVADAPVSVRPVVAARSATAEIRTPVRSGTAEIRTHLRSGTGELKPPTASSITNAPITPVSSAERQSTAMTTNLRCWSCLQRNRVRTPRRGGCFLCTGCNATMLVVDPIVGLTCDIAQAESKGINLNRQANGTDPG